jgi:hypothetical protein
LNDVHFSAIHFEQCSLSRLEIKMQTLVSEVVGTFAGDAEALLIGFLRIVVQTVMAPVDHIANACDVAGVLAMRRSAQRPETGRARRVLVLGSRRSDRSRRRRGPFGCLGALSELT